MIEMRELGLEVLFVVIELTLVELKGRGKCFDAGGLIGMKS
jgi:hypothetical protein